MDNKVTENKEMNKQSWNMKVYRLTSWNSTMCTEIKCNACQKSEHHVLPVTSLKISFLKEKEIQNNNVIFLPSQDESQLRFNMAKPS